MLIKMNEKTRKLLYKFQKYGALTIVFIFITIAWGLALLGSFLIQPIVNTLTLYSLGFTPFWLCITYVISLVLGMACSVLSIRNVKRADPAVIFRA